MSSAVKYQYSKKRKRGHKGNRVLLTLDQAVKLLLSIQIYSRENSITHYNKWNQEQNGESVPLVKKLSELDGQNYTKAKSIYDATDMLGVKIEEMVSEQDNFKAKLDLNRERSILDRKKQVQDLNDNIKFLQEKIHESSLQIEILLDIRRNWNQVESEDKIKSMLEATEAMKLKHEKDFEYVNRHHTTAIETIQKRVEKSLRELGSSVTQYEIDHLSVRNCDLLSFNRRLKKELSRSKLEIRNVESTIERLELENTLLSASWISVDWNLNSLVTGPGIGREHKKVVEHVSAVNPPETENPPSAPTNPEILQKSSYHSPLKAILSSFHFSRRHHGDSKQMHQLKLPSLTASHKSQEALKNNLGEIQAALLELSQGGLYPNQRLQPSELNIPQILAIETGKSNISGLALKGKSVRLFPLDPANNCGAQFYTAKALEDPVVL